MRRDLARLAVDAGRARAVNWRSVADEGLFESGWADSSIPLEFGVLPTGMVMLRGAAFKQPFPTTVVAGETIFTLPVECRPSVGLVIPCTMLELDGTAGAFRSLLVSDSGAVTASYQDDVYTGIWPDGSSFLL